MEKRHEHVKQKNDQEIWNGKETERCDVEKQWNTGHDIEIGKSDVEKRQRFHKEWRQEDLTWKKRQLYKEKKLNICCRRDSEIWYESMTGRFDT